MPNYCLSTKQTGTCSPGVSTVLRTGCSSMPGYGSSLKFCAIYININTHAVQLHSVAIARRGRKGLWPIKFLAGPLGCPHFSYRRAVECKVGWCEMPTGVCSSHTVQVLYYCQPNARENVNCTYNRSWGISNTNNSCQKCRRSHHRGSTSRQ